MPDSMTCRLKDSRISAIHFVIAARVNLRLLAQTGGFVFAFVGLSVSVITEKVVDKLLRYL